MRDALVAEAVDRMAHQLRNPLQAVTVNLEVIRLKAGDAAEAGEELERLTRVVDENVRLLDRRIAMLIALARRDEGATESVDLTGYLSEAVSALGLDDGEEGPTLELRSEDAPEQADVRARKGALLALLLALARRGRAAGEAELYLAVSREGERVVMEAGIGPEGRGEWLPAEARRELERATERAGGEPMPAGDGPGSAEEPGRAGDPTAPFRVAFPSA